MDSLDIVRVPDPSCRWFAETGQALCGTFLAALLFLVFQAVFSWAAGPMDWIEASVGAVGEWVQSLMPEGLEQNLSLQDMADLLSFIKNWRYLDGQIPTAP